MDMDSSVVIPGWGGWVEVKEDIRGLIVKEINTIKNK